MRLGMLVVLVVVLVGCAAWQRLQDEDVGRGFREASAAMAASNPVDARGGAGAVLQQSCSSDYSCGFGAVCVKAEFQLAGYCAKAVDEYGLPTYPAPRGDSWGPGGPGQCSFDPDCPISFRCAKEAGALTGACIKRY